NSRFLVLTFFVLVNIIGEYLFYIRFEQAFGPTFDIKHTCSTRKIQSRSLQIIWQIIAIVFLYLLFVWGLSCFAVFSFFNSFLRLNPSVSIIEIIYTSKFPMGAMYDPTNDGKGNENPG